MAKTKIDLWESAMKCDSLVVGSGGWPGGEENKGLVPTTGVARWKTSIERDSGSDFARWDPRFVALLLSMSLLEGGE